MSESIEPKEMSPESLMVIESEWLAAEAGTSYDDYGDHYYDVKELLAHIKWLEQRS